VSGTAAEISIAHPAEVRDRDDPDAVAAALRPLRFRPLRRVLGRIARWANAGEIGRRYNAFGLESVLGVPIVVMPGVLNPKLMRTGEFFAAHINARVIPDDASVLDMGTGSGICAVFAARHASHVTAVDINPSAVCCARASVLINRVQDKVEVLRSDLFERLAGQRFDVVLFNPPFLRGAPEDNLDRAWRSDDVAERFARALPRHLTASGCALILLSTFGAPALFVEEFRKQRFSMSVVAQREFFNERLVLLRLSRNARTGQPS
jgi:release factor glutamine methyltransferase